MKKNWCDLVAFYEWVYEWVMIRVWFGQFGPFRDDRLYTGTALPAHLPEET